MLHALGVKETKAAGPTEFESPFNFTSYRVHYWCFTEGFPRIPSGSAENLEGLNTYSC